MPRKADQGAKNPLRGQQQATGMGTEAVLQESTALLRGIVESSPMGIHMYELDDEDRLVFIGANPAADTLLSVDNSQFIGKTLEDAFPPLMETEVPDRYRRAARHGESWSTEQIVYDHGEISGAYEVCAFQMAPGRTAVLFSDITARKQAEEALRKSEVKFRALVETTSDWIWEVDDNGVYTYASPQIETILGYKPQEVIGKTPFELMPPEEVAKTVEVFKTLRETHKPMVALENINLHKDGRRIYLETSGVPVLNESGEVTGFRGVDRDITARKQAEQALQESEEKYRVLVERANDGIGISHEGRLVFANQSFANMFGYRIDEILDTSIENFVHPDERAILLERNKRRVKGEEVENIYTIKGVTKDGQTIFVEVNAGVVTYQSQPAAIVFLRDVTDRMKAEERLKESEMRYRSLIENAPIVVWITNQYGETTYISPNVREVYGYTADEIVAAGEELWFGRIHPEDRSPAMRAFESLFSDRKPYDIKYRIQRKDEKWIWLHDRANVVTQRDGQWVAHGIFSDITTQKHQEEALRQTEKMQVVGQLAGGVAHDFNNQLAGIIGYANLLRAKLGDQPKLAQYVEHILSASDHAATLTRQLLAFARKGNYLAVHVDMHKLIAEVVSMLWLSAHKDIHIKQQLDAKIPLVMGDPTQLQNALLNLALNARDAMPEGGELVFATDTAEIDGAQRKIDSVKIESGTYICVSVTDSGTGMDDDTRQHMFEPFYTTKEEGMGTGMGLAAVYGTVRAHGGGVAVDSELGRGTTIHVYLPLASKEAVAHAGTETPPTVVEGSGCVLVVDDEEVVLDSVSEMVHDLGYTVYSYSDGTAALELYQKEWQRIDLVIMDMVMPNMSGRAALQAMREINPNVIALLTSGYSMDGEARAGMKDGARGFIQKPCGLAELSQIIANALTARRQSR